MYSTSARLCCGVTCTCDDHRWRNDGHAVHGHRQHGSRQTLGAATGVHLGHEAEVEDADLAVRRADEVARVRVRVQVTRLQQLDQVRVQQRRAQLAHV